MAEEGLAAEGTTEVGSTEGLGQSSEGLTTDGVGEQAANGSVEEPKYSVKVDGREIEVTLDELTAGYSRHQDYTKKTQSLASERQRLAQLNDLSVALERNPQQTLAALIPALGVNPVDLARALGLNLGQAQEEDLDPLERASRKIDQFMSAQEQRNAAERDAALRAQQASQVEMQIKADLADLHESYGTFDDRALMNYAVDHGTTNLRVALQAFQYEMDQERRLAEKNRIVDQKRRAGVVEGGTSSAPGTVVRGGSGQRMSVREALTAALAEHS
jgi:hypothetical protein